jgi:hypothetical protein
MPTLDMACPINWGHAHNKALKGRWAQPRGLQGSSRLINLVRPGFGPSQAVIQAPTGSFTNSPTWHEAPGNPGMAALRFITDSGARTVSGPFTPDAADTNAGGVGSNYAAACSVVVYSTPQFGCFFGHGDENVTNKGWALFIGNGGGASGGNFDFLRNTLQWHGSGVAFELGKPYRLAVTQRTLASGTAWELEMFLNGRPVYFTNPNQETNSPWPSTPVTLGYQEGPWRFLDGSVWDCGIWWRPWYAADALLDYEQSLAGNPDVLRWVKPRSYFFVSGGGAGGTGGAWWWSKYGEAVACV